MKIAVVGATGMVGAVMLKLLEERQFPVTKLIPVASERSVGKKISYKGVDHTIVGLATAVEMRADIAIFSAGAKVLTSSFAFASLPELLNLQSKVME